MILFFSEKTTIQFFCGSTICSMGAFSAKKYTKMLFLPFYTYTGSPFFCFSVIKHTLISRFCINNYLTIKTILLLTRFSEVFPFIRSITIFMVNLLFRPFPHYPKPCKTMRQIRSIINPYLSVSLTIGFLTSDFPQNLIFLPSKFAHFWVVIQNRTHVFCGQVIAFIFSGDYARFSHNDLSSFLVRDYQAFQPLGNPEDLVYNTLKEITTKKSWIE